MFTLYFIGFGITLLVSLIHLAWRLAEEDAYRLDIMDILMSMLSILILSLFSWAVILVTGMMFVFKLAKKQMRKND
ncbi:MAG TPA: hypothetical protein EYG74_08705 [Sulfurimonas autotrophica]|nr:hypothetical protein [Sulfurimonas autotrophica]